MRYSFDQLKRLPVVTVSGQKLGRVVDVEVDAETHQIMEFIVSPRRSLAHLWRGELLIAPNQVRSITAEAMTVDDLVTTKGVPVPLTPPVSVAE